MDQNLKTGRRSRVLQIGAAALLLAFSAIIQAAVLKLDDSCTVSILNRSVQAAADGNWRLSDVPSFMGQIFVSHHQCAMNVLPPFVD